MNANGKRALFDCESAARGSLCRTALHASIACLRWLSTHTGGSADAGRHVVSLQRSIALARKHSPSASVDGAAREAHLAPPIMLRISDTAASFSPRRPGGPRLVWEAWR